MNKDNSKLLIDEHPLQVLPTLACKVGLSGAIILQQVHYWIVIAKKAKDDRKFIDGRWWVYNSYEEWKENFPWWSLPTIRRTIQRLEKFDLLISKEMRAQDWDHTKWYSVNYEALNELTDSIKVIPSDDSDSDNPAGQDESFLNSIAETTPKTTPKNIDSENQKDSLLSFLQEQAYGLFSDIQVWWNVKRTLESDAVGISGTKEQITISGLSEHPKGGQFSLAEIWEDRFTRSFQNLGIQVTFTE